MRYSSCSLDGGRTLRGIIKEDHHSMHPGSTSVLAVAFAAVMASAPVTAALAQGSKTSSPAELVNSLNALLDMLG